MSVEWNKEIIIDWFKPQRWQQIIFLFPVLLGFVVGRWRTWSIYGGNTIWLRLFSSNLLQSFRVLEKSSNKVHMLKLVELHVEIEIMRAWEWSSGKYAWERKLERNERKISWGKHFERIVNDPDAHKGAVTQKRFDGAVQQPRNQKRSLPFHLARKTPWKGSKCRKADWNWFILVGSKRFYWTVILQEWNCLAKMDTNPT